MTTEDDTFNRLRREDFYSVYSRWLSTTPPGSMSPPYLKGTGWTFPEFHAEFKK